MSEIENLSILIAKEIASNGELLRKQYFENKSSFGIGYCFLDNLLDDKFVLELYKAFPKGGEPWREMSSFREKKLTTKQFQEVPKILGDITFALQSDKVLKKVGEIVSINNLSGDETLYAGGLSSMRKGDFLNPHIDNSHDQERKFYRRLNALFYVTPNWKREFGGNLELWNKDVTKSVEIESLFNRLVIMETNPWSWHSVNKVKNTNENRCCVSNYYFSEESPTGDEYYHVTSFAGRPEEPLKRLMSKADNVLRSSVRLLIKGGVGKKDQFKQTGK